MSKRFGRNQKRKLREAVETLKAEATKQKANAEHYRKVRSRKEMQFDMLVTAIEQIAPHSVCLPAKTIEVENNHGYFNLAIYPPIDWTAYDATAPVESVYFSEQRLQEFCVDIEEYRDKFETLVHVYTKDHDCNMHYMISNDVLYTMGLPAEELMKQFTNSWIYDKIMPRR